MLPLPNHVMLNHLYQRDYDGNDDLKDVMILGTTVRYRDKFVTTVFYRPKPKTRKRGDEGDEEEGGISVGSETPLFSSDGQEKEDILILEDKSEDETK